MSFVGTQTIIFVLNINSIEADMDALDFYKSEDAFGFKRNTRKLWINILIINSLFVIFWFGFYLHIYGFKVTKDTSTFVMFCIGPLVPLGASMIRLINDRILWWNVMFRKEGNDYYLYKKGKKISKRICSVVSAWVIARYDMGRYVSIIDEDGKEIMLFKGLSRTEAEQVTSTISTTLQVPLKVIPLP